MEIRLTMSYSGVSTLLKTIAGETNGLHLDPNSHISYQGE